MISRILTPLLILFTCYSANAQLSLTLDVFASGFSSPIGIYNAGGSNPLLYVVERSGYIRIIEPGGTVIAQPFLDIDNLVIPTGGNSEQGLLGLAFHPDFVVNGYFFVHYTNNSGNSQISRFSTTLNPDVADVNSEKSIMLIDQPFGNHNGGDLAFGPDGYLYIGMGDGGSGSDPLNSGQDPESLLGKMLRIDIDTDDNTPYAIPPDNPFVEDASTLDEIWALGLRNPWRFSFDRLTGDLWMADVGQNAWEEIDFQPASSTGGENYGWRCYEGDATHITGGCPDASTFVPPVFDYNHNGFTHCSVTGGYVYRGCENADMTGNYFYADFCSGRFSMLSPIGNGQFANTHIQTFGGHVISAFGEDISGELYVARFNNGTIYKLRSNNSTTIGDLFMSGNTLTAQQGFTTYQWYLNGELIPGATSNVYEATQSGSYTVVVTNGSNCEFESNPLDFVLSNTFETAKIRSLRINPNPFSDRVAIIVAFNEATEYNLSIHDLSGKKITEQTILGSSSEQIVQFDLADVSSGVYLLKIENEHGQMSRKLVKN